MRRGTAAVEFALVLPPVIALLLAVVEWGRLFTQETALVHIVRDAASAGSHTRTVDGPATAARARCIDALDDAGYDTTAAVISTSLTTVNSGVILNVDVTVPFVPLGGLVPVPEHLHAAATLRMQTP